VHPDAEQPRDPSQVAERMFSWMHRARRLVDGRLAEINLSMPRMKMLGKLSEGPSNQNKLACAFDLAPRTVTEIVDGLEKAGLVERVVDPNDRRARLVHLTDAGRQAHEGAWAVKKEIVTSLLGSLEPDELNQLGFLFDRLHSRLEAADEPAATTAEHHPATVPGH
jgi:DNA-binding MarR family transcriptional regulator